MYAIRSYYEMDKQKNFTVTVTDLKTLEPQGGVEVELYSYQNQP